MLIVLIMIFAGSSSLAKDSGLVLSGVVPLAAEVVVQNNQIIHKSSAGLKTSVQKRAIASVIQVTAP
ncbi:hypothetical protein AZI86_07640 [Bdellovibrio bacteriovorus]|uniref:Uncharacterized protein n=2 Tax=Bdellovibrio bacteriovorus TaxID=959 RepID=A0A150WRE3_BDEBC|nr:hypothetical protein AZI86_07640 [Bdellovibrio bacteriovorus]